MSNILSKVLVVDAFLQELTALQDKESLHNFGSKLCLVIVGESGIQVEMDRVPEAIISLLTKSQICTNTEEKPAFSKARALHGGFSDDAINNWRHSGLLQLPCGN